MSTAYSQSLTLSPTSSRALRARFLSPRPSTMPTLSARGRRTTTIRQARITWKDRNQQLRMKAHKRSKGDSITSGPISDLCMPLRLVACTSCDPQACPNCRPQCVKTTFVMYWIKYTCSQFSGEVSGIYTRKLYKSLGAVHKADMTLVGTRTRARNDASRSKENPRGRTYTPAQ